MSRRLLVALLCLGVVLGAVASTALARRAAQGAQKVRILRATEFDRNAPASCYRVYVSTVNRNWATAAYDGSTQPPCAQYGSDGVIIMHYRAGRWHKVADGSSFTCPLPGHIPSAVQRDLKLSCVHGSV